VDDLIGAEARQLTVLGFESGPPSETQTTEIESPMK
jgi:hypothetical protein